MSDIEKEFYNVFERIDTSFQSKNISKMKVTLKGAANNTNNLIDALLRKSLVKQNPYDYNDDNSNSFNLPDEKVFTESDRPMVIYERLKASITALEYLSSNIPDSLEYFDDLFLENSRKVLAYFAFNNLVSSNNINTRTIKDLTDKIINGNDEIFKRVVQDIIKLLADNYQTIQSFLEDVTKYKKEVYKTVIRFEIFPNLTKDFSEKLFLDSPEIYMTKLEDYIKNNRSDLVFNRMWMPEAIRECYNLTDNDALEKIASTFLSDSDKEKLETSSNSPRERLIKIITNLSTSKHSLNEIYSNLDFNLKLIRNRKKNLSEKIHEFLSKLLNMANQDDFFHIEYINPQTKTIQKDTINISDFISSIKKKILLFSEITKPTSNVAAKIKRGTEDALYNFLDETYLSLLLLKERIIGVDLELRLNIPKSIRPKFKDSKNNIEDLNALIIKVGEQRRRFILDQDLFLKGKDKKK